MQDRYDMIVAGGGMAGVAAAVAAARRGASVLLIEQYGSLGGMATAGLVNPFMPYYLNRGGDDWDLSHPINQGFFQEVLDGLKELGGLHENTWTFHEEILKIVLDRMTKQYGITVLFHTFVKGTARTGSKVESVTVVNKSGEHTYAASYFVDATGDADLSVLAGCDYEIGREPDHGCQPMSLCFRLANVDLDRYDEKSATALYQEFRAKGLLKNPREDILTFPNMLPGVLHFNTTRIVQKSAVNAEDLTAAEMEAREQMYEMYRFLKDNIPGFEKCELLMSAPQVGVRESRRIVGEYVITSEDILSARKFPDSVARGDYPIDIHNPQGTGTEMHHIPTNDYYTIPYRSLLPKGVDNLIVAGRPISATHEAHSAYRVMPITTCIGEGAGSAVSIALRSGCALREVAAADIHALLDETGGLY